MPRQKAEAAGAGCTTTYNAPDKRVNIYDRNLLGVAGTEDSIHQRERLLRLSQFVIGTTAKERRTELVKGLVQVGVLYNPRKKTSLTRPEVIDAVRYVCDLPSFPSMAIDSAIDDLVREGTLVWYRGGQETVTLEPRAAIQWDRMVKSTFGTYEQAVAFVQGEVEREYGTLGDEDRDTVGNVFEATVLDIVASQGDMAASIFSGTPGAVPEGRVDVGHGAIFREIKERKLRDAVQRAFRRAFNNPSESLARVLAWTANTYLLTKVLNLDPECRALERDMFSTCRLFLDTNVLLACLLPSHPKNREISRLLQVCRKLGVEMRYTDRTSHELTNVINRSNELYSQNPSMKQPSIGFHEHDVIKSYTQNYRNTGMTWQQYYLMLSRSANILTNQHGIIQDESDYENLVPADEVVAFAPLVSQVSGFHLKSPGVAAHDAFHILLIEKLRLSGEHLAFGSPWFLSLDYTLADAERLRKIKRTATEYNSTITCDLWVDILLPFVSPDVRDEGLDEVYASLAGSHFFPVARTISVGDLIRHIAPYLQDPLLDADDITWILQHDHLQDVLKAAAQSSIEPDVQTVGTVIAGLIDQRKDEKLVQLGKSLTDVQSRLSASETRLQQLAASEKEAGELKKRLEVVEGKEPTLDFVNDVVVAFGLSLTLTSISYLIWAATSRIEAVVGSISLGVVLIVLALGVLRRYRMVKRGSS